VASRRCAFKAAGFVAMKRLKRKPMSRTFTAIAVLAALIALSASAATADENPYSANSMLPACTAVLTVRLPCLTIWFSGQPGLSRQYFAARTDQRNFSDQLPDEQVAKRIEVLRDQDKSAGSTDHVFSIVLFEPTRRIRMLRAP